MSDTVKKFSKHKGYESLPRELLQSKDLTLEAIGLLVNMASYPDSWILHKTELRTRFKNGKRVVDRVWDELVENNYIVQFRKRIGRTYEFRYFFTVVPYEYDEIQAMLLSNMADGFMLYHKEMKNENFKVSDLSAYIFCDNKDKLDFSFWGSQNGNPTEHDNTSIPWGSQFELPNLGFPKREPSKLTIKEINYKEIDNNNKYINNASENEQHLVDELSADDSTVGRAIKFLKSTGLDTSAILDIAMHLCAQPHLAIPELIVQQTQLTNSLVKLGKMYSYANYFIKGLEMRYVGFESNLDRSEIDAYYAKESDKYAHFEIPLDWK